MNGPERRIARLELAAGTELPWHLPPDEWTDAQLLAVAAPGRRTIEDDELRAIAEGTS